MSGPDTRIPLFPLGTVLFPGGLLPLRIFEPRYVSMIGECMRENRGFGVCAIRQGGETGEAAIPFGVGTLAMVERFDQGEDGLLHITARGARRFRVLATEIQPDQLIRAEVAWLEEPEPVSLPDRYAPLADLLTDILGRLEGELQGVAVDTADGVAVAARLTEWLPLNLDRRQAILENQDPHDRLALLASALGQSPDP